MITELLIARKMCNYLVEIGISEACRIKTEININLVAKEFI